MRLKDLVAGWAEIHDSADRSVTGITLDSREARSGSVFLACPGHLSHGLLYARSAIEAGAAAVLYDAPPAGFEPAALASPEGVPVVRLPGLKQLLGPIAARFYGEPSRNRIVVGVTGTNGKTSCCHYLAQLWSGLGRNCGVMGTLGNGVWSDERGELEAVTGNGRTTPDAVTVQAELARFDCPVVAMEVSSHGLDQGRVNGVEFSGAVFTNLTRDHLDYHASMDAYADAKLRLFRNSSLKWVSVNLDDDFGSRVLEVVPASAKVVVYGVKVSPQSSAETRGHHWLWASKIVSDTKGSVLSVASSWGRFELQTTLIGHFNVGNVLAAAGVLLLSGVPLKAVVEGVACLRPVRGRMERFGGGERPLVVVDYAHTPDALEQVLKALREYTKGRLICVFGCGGDRDAGKRPEMGRAAEHYADRVVVTDDNPRSEDGDRIIEGILAGMLNPAGVQIERDREAAIRAAIGEANPGDIVLVAGKGHEVGQEVNGRVYPFSDRQQVSKCLGVANPHV
ncbi:MAG: UDP-N-acetylmuramoyl-L-alanyl-D-glutamate--2,6-diaminopimelate ligase [Gammaproteobacteria bacterium]|nr:UDP-N-acetylmuramoyl-L-alanyl-D-glutamate--2,6-diaminopimelate ligase [Gammaproteobacteria bacterium]